MNAHTITELIEAMTIEQLEAARKDIETAVQARREEHRAAVIREVEALVVRRGWTSVWDLLGLQKGRGKAPLNPAKYRNPENPSETWTGRGRRPRWFIEAVEAGVDEADLLVESRAGR